MINIIVSVGNGALLLMKLGKFSGSSNSRAALQCGAQLEESKCGVATHCRYHTSEKRLSSMYKSLVENESTNGDMLSISLLSGMCVTIDYKCYEFRF